MLSSSLASAIASVGWRHQWVYDFETTHTRRLLNGQYYKCWNPKEKKSDSSCWHLSRNVSASCLRGRMRLIAFCKIKSMRTLNGCQETLSSNLTLLPPSRVHLYDDEIPCRNRSVAHLPKRCLEWLKRKAFGRYRLKQCLSLDWGKVSRLSQNVLAYCWFVSVHGG